jgi:hypothetical protein
MKTKTARRQALPKGRRVSGAGGDGQGAEASRSSARAPFIFGEELAEAILALPAPKLEALAAWADRCRDAVKAGIEIRAIGFNFQEGAQ